MKCANASAFLYSAQFSPVAHGVIMYLRGEDIKN